jgi:hypothetical protein
MWKDETMLQVLRVLSTAIVFVGLVACGSMLPGGPGDDPGEFTGAIAAVQPGPVVTRVLIKLEEPALSATRYEQVYLNLMKETEILVPQADGSIAAGGVNDLVVGARVRARHKGVELRSSTLQYPVTRVEILSR